MLSSLYEKCIRRPAPAWLRRSSPFGLIAKVVRKWFCVSVVPFIPFNGLRIWAYRRLGFQIGRHVFIGMQCYLDDLHPQRMIIEDDVVVSYRVTFACHGPRTRDHRMILRQGSYVGTCAILLGGGLHGDVEIGPYATVGAGALVARSVPPLATVAGIPAKVVRTGRTPWEADDGRTEELCRKFGVEPSPPPSARPNA